ncbi:hypothetical protein OIU77_027200 [Salix suchowensis]|uniref:Uncharacterized protein n=1 Tax=Salix suchowensis TaxID=1278906 RepID=A0ABQ9BNS8_9ROSI|nr:hypothetical protein OIU77_027200 [Salix suchowensis]
MPLYNGNPATNYLNKHGINSIALVYNPVSLVASVVYHLFLYREMKLVELPVSLFITFSLAASVVLNFSSAVFLYLLFNILLWVIVLWSYKPSKVEFDGLWPTLQSLCDGEEDPCVMNKVENQSNGNAESSCEVAGDTCFKSENHNNEKDQGNGNAESSCNVEEDPCVMNKVENQSNGNAESSCEVAGDTCFKSEYHNNENHQGNGNAESSCDVAGDTYVESKSENHNNEKDRDNGNGNGKDNDEKYGCSDGCDDDDDGNAGAIGGQDVAEEFDDNLKKRIEDFIAKVNKRWREERLIEASNEQST